MKLADKPRVNLHYAYDEIVVPIKHGQIHQVHECLERIGQIDLEAEYTVKIEKQRLKRSLDANAYLWVLIGKLGEKLFKSDLDIYREIIRDNGVFEIVPIKEAAIPTWRRNWAYKGQGWICEDLGACRNFKGYHNIKTYYGSSTYDTKEMSRLIDAVIAECKEQGIETMTPNEIERLKQQWAI